MKPGSVLMAASLMVAITGCGTARRYHPELDDAYKNGFADAKDDCFAVEMANKAYIERLKKFNQVKEDGSLR